MNPLIQRSNAGILSAHDAAVRLRNAPEWAIREINVARRAAGLEAVTRAATSSTIKPPSRPVARAKVPTGRAPTKRSTTVALFPFPGRGETPAGAVETFSRDAFREWCSDVRAGRMPAPAIRLGHGQPSLPGSIEVKLTDAGPVILWSPDVSDHRSRAALALVESGGDDGAAVSGEFRSVCGSLGGGERFVSTAELHGVAICRRTAESALWPAARCFVLDTSRPVAEQLKALATRALLRSRSAL